MAADAQVIVGIDVQGVVPVFRNIVCVFVLAVCRQGAYGKLRVCHNLLT